VENKENVKSAYLTLLILGIIEAVLTRFAGNLIAIAVFITALIIRSKLSKNDPPVPTPAGIKFMLAGSAVHFSTIIITLIGVMFFLSSREYQMIFSMQKLINFLMGTAFVLIVIGCIMVYKEYKDIRA
jgi:hypothetical protein